MSRLTIAALPAAALALAVTLSPLASRVSNAQPAGLPGAASAEPAPTALPPAPDAFQPPVIEAPGSGSAPGGGGAPPPPRVPTPGLARNAPLPAPAPVPPPPPLPPTPPVARIPHVSPDSVPSDDSLTNHHFDANFTGGVTAATVAEFLSREVPGLNVLLPNNAGEIVMPDMQLKNVNMRELMAAITAASNVDMANGNPGYSLTSIPGAPNIVIFQRLQPAPAPHGQGEGMGGMGMGSGGGTPGMPGTEGIGFGGGSGAGGGAFVPGVSGMPGGGGGVFSTPSPHSPPGKKETQFFDLSGILQSKELKVDDITTAIRTAWSSVEGGKMPPEGALKFHQETRLLIVTATPDYMRSASSIVNLLLQRTRPSENERDQAMKAVEQKAMMVEEARMRAEDARRQAEMERQAMEERNHDVREKLQARITDLELELAKLRQQQGAVSR